MVTQDIYALTLALINLNQSVGSVLKSGFT